MEIDRRLSRIDINLLVTLKVLLEECNVTRAAKRLHLSQPSVSRALQRLRELFEDPLFTRAAHGLVPTPKAKALESALLTVLSDLDSIIYSAPFDAAKASGNIRIGMAPEVSCAIVPPLIDKVRQQAAQINIFTQHSLRNYKEQLREGYLDFAIVNTYQPEQDFIFQQACSSPFVCWMRKDHPLANKQKLSSLDLASASEVSYYSSQLYEAKASDYDALMAQAGIRFERRLLTTTDLITSLEVLLRSDGIAIASAHIKAFKLIDKQLIYKTVPQIQQFTQAMEKLYLVQHKRSTYSALHEMIKQLIMIIAQHLK